MQISDTDFPVSEVFASIQGEGNYAGVNCLFVRFQLCNLTCTWCDTKYTWTRFSDRFDLFKADDLKKKINAFDKHHVIFTGGEPDLFRLDLLIDEGRQYHVESNGTIIPTAPLNMTLRDGTTIVRDAMDKAIISRFNWVVSPKLSNAKQEIVPEALTFWSQQPYAIFKFIAETPQDLDEIETLIAQYNILQHKVYIGLLGTTIESQCKPDMAEDIIQRGFHYSPRLHILLWGQERGK